ncbi:hypothetical protein Rhopal_000963-T1 [Rhodotorula paludigena]|uniref:Choline kinase n=1 Tax=Rhodotorula paludigena TaxID=86838 RepID=A0AAV5GCJ5_9BASI|nr:hypothetical protein Rhopal_000963-T1 [Rhodotorula paludigena]
MPVSPAYSPALVQIPPQTSPLLLPARDPPGHHRRQSSGDSFSLTHNHRNPDIPAGDDLEFLAPGQWADHDDDGDSGPDSSDDEDDADPFDEDADVEDWTLEDGHVQGVPCSNLRLDAKQYKTEPFLALLLHLVRDQLGVLGWNSLPLDTPPSLIHIHKVSGSLTNAVFFISIPETEVEVEAAAPVESPGSHALDAAAPTSSPTRDFPPETDARMLPATVFSELERGRQAAATPKPRAATPSPPTPATPQPATSRLPGHFPDSSEGTPSGSPAARSSSLPAHGSDAPPATEKILLSAPTLLLRIYGPQSGSLISRRNELHILHTLSSQYGIGAHVLGTFGNGRVEEYFHSRALTKDEMRDPRVSRWIGRRMRELHSVELEQMIPPQTEEEAERERERRRSKRSRSRDPAGAAAAARPGPEPLVNSSGSGARSPPTKSPVSGASVYSTSSSSSVFSFGTTSSSSSSIRSHSSSYSTSSLASVSTLNSGSYSAGTPRSLVSSPEMLPVRTPSESRADDKKRARRRGTSSRGGSQGRARDTKLCVWENITRWTREAKNVLRELDELAQLPGFERLLSTPSSASSPSGPGTPTSPAASAGDDAEHIPPLSSPSRTFAVRSTLNLPLFEQQVRLYRAFVHRHERAHGRSKRVFAHNDTQYGNLLVMTPRGGSKEDEDELDRRAQREGGAHRRLIVVDFEYAGANPRAFDIANHFCEWQADYHHPSLSHSLSAHQPYPTASERARFLRAYIGCDGGFDGPGDGEAPSPAAAGDDARVERLQDEVRVWEASSHAVWAVWGIVQAKEDLLARIAVWKDKAQRGAPLHSPLPPPAEPQQQQQQQDQSLVESVEALGLDEAQVGDLVDLDELEDVGEVYDYLSYAAERMGMFRRALEELQVI